MYSTWSPHQVMHTISDIVLGVGCWVCEVLYFYAVLCIPCLRIRKSALRVCVDKPMHPTKYKPIVLRTCTNYTKPVMTAMVTSGKEGNVHFDQNYN